MSSPRGRMPLLLALAAVLVAGGGYLALRVINPVGNEWQCVQGEAPATTAEGTRSCFPEGSTLPAGFTWDPLGNRPLAHSCSGSDWVKVTDAQGRSDCAKAGAPLPAGYRPA